MSQQSALEIALAHSMTEDEYETVLKMLGSEPNDVGIKGKFLVR